MTARVKGPQPIEGEYLEATPAGAYIRRPALGTARGIRRELAQTYLEFRRGQIDAETTKTAVFTLRTILEAVRTDEIESRLAQLEEQTR